MVHQIQMQPFKTGCSILQAVEAQPDVDTKVKMKSRLWLFFLFRFCHLFQFTQFCAPLSFWLSSPFPPVLFFPGAVAPVALPAHARWSPFPLQTFPEHGERGGWRGGSPDTPRQAPLAQSQVAARNCAALSQKHLWEKTANFTEVNL